MASFTPTQGRYLSYIHAYTSLHGYPPAEAEIAAAMCVAPPSVNQMVKTLEKRGLISRQPGVARALRVLVPEEDIPSWRSGGSAASPARSNERRSPARVNYESPRESTPASLYVLNVYMIQGPTSDKFAHKEVSRAIEIRGDQTLHELHEAIFQAYDRWDQHLYEFQFGRRPFDPDGPNYGLPDSRENESKSLNARTTLLDELGLTPERAFGYWFDFGDDWYHQILVERIDDAIPTVTYPRVTRRVGKSPPQYLDDDGAGDDATRMPRPQRAGKKRSPAKNKSRR